MKSPNEYEQLAYQAQKRNDWFSAAEYWEKASQASAGRKRSEMYDELARQARTKANT